MKANPILSIIIVSFNTKELLKQTINSIFKSEKNGNFYEIIVVDNNSSDKSIEMVKKNFKKVKIIESQKNLGFAKANNLGASHAKGKYLFFLNSDTIVKSGALLQMIEFFEKNQNIGVLGPKLVLKSGRVQPYCIGQKSSISQAFKNRLAKLLFKLGFPKKSLARLSLEYWDWSKPIQVDWVTGAALMIKRKIFKKNRFDENIFMYFEDQDLCLRVKKNGSEIWSLPNAKIIHLGGKSLKLDKARKKYYYQSQDYFFKKHFGAFNYVVMKIISFPIRMQINLKR